MLLNSINGRRLSNATMRRSCCAIGMSSLTKSHCVNSTTKTWKNYYEARVAMQWRLQYNQDDTKLVSEGQHQCTYMTDRSLSQQLEHDASRLHADTNHD